MVKKMEATHAKLAEAYDTLKVKSDKSASDAIKAKSEANEFKSLLSFKENQVLLAVELIFDNNLGINTELQGKFNNLFTKMLILLLALLEGVNVVITRLVLDRFHDSSIPPRKCAESSESVLKPEKV